MKRLGLACLLLLPNLLGAQVADLRLPISLDADSTDWDGKNSMLMFRGLRLSQGEMGVSADQGRASKLDFQDSVWRFEGNVIIDVENGHIECASADLKFSDHTLRLASIKGSPATFALRRPDSDEITYGEAGQLEYDLATGIVEFADNAVITERGNRISSSYLAYNIVEQRIKAQSTGNGDDKVKIIYTPGDTPAPDIEVEAGAADP
ncbi:MAG: hypothetical protein O2907_01685 [Proteobacteria bacterium]|nr:hypothetical protein [Pseudomonadota bacterium]